MQRLTVIIATYNRAGLLRGALEAIAAQEPTGTEMAVIVADNGSNDETRAVFDRVSSAAPPSIEWTYLMEPTPGKSNAVNAALGRARGEHLAFTDDDVRPEPGWMAALARAFAQPEVDFVVGRIYPLWQADPPAWLTPALYGVLGVPDNGPSACRIAAGHNEHVMPIGTNMAVTRAVVTRVGGLRTDLGKMRGTLRTGEDHEFYLRLLHAGCKGVYAPDALVGHIVPADRLNRSYFRRWFYENGRNVATLEAAYPRRTPMLLGVPRYLWRQSALSALALGRATVGRNSANRFRRLVALIWFAGYVWESLLRRHGNPTASSIVSAESV